MISLVSSHQLKVVERLKAKLPTKTVIAKADLRIVGKLDRVAIKARRIKLHYAPPEIDTYEAIYDYLDTHPTAMSNNGIKYLYYYEGKIYQLTELCGLCSDEISPELLRSRLTTMCIKDALNLSIQRPRLNRSHKQVFEYHGVEYTAKELAMLCGMDSKTFATHLQGTGDVYKVIENYRHRVGDRYDAKGFLLFEHEGADKNLLELAKATRIPLETLYIRLRTQKLSVEEAIALSTDKE